MNNQDPFALSRPQNENEKPESDPNDVFFSVRPEVEKEKYKKPEPIPESMPGGSAPWYEKFGKALSLQGQAAPQPKAFPATAKSVASGATFGLSENVPGLKITDEEKKEYPEIIEAYKAGAGLESIGLLNKAFNNPLVKLASKSPVASKALTSLAEITGWGLTGATDKVLTDSFQGKMPTAEDVLTHGADWAALDAVLKGAGLTGKFASWLIGKSKKSVKPSWQLVNDLINDMKKEGIDISQTDRVTSKVLSELEKPIEQAKTTVKDIKLSQKPYPETPEVIGKVTLGTAPKTPPSGPFGQTPPSPPSYEKVSIGFKPAEVASKKLEPIQFKTVSDSAEKLSEAYQPKEVSFDKSYERLAKQRTESLVESVGERADTEKLLGENVQKDIDANFKKAEETYTPLYKEVESGAKNVQHSPKATIDLVNNVLKEINYLKTKPEGYQKVINTLSSTLDDLGVKVVEFNNKLILRDIKGNPIKLEKLLVKEDISLSKTMELARRLNKIVDYDIVGASIKNKLKPVVKSLKNEIKETLKKSNPDLHKKFIQAESSYADTAKKFGNDSISDIRYQSKSEKVAARILEPTVLENLKKTTTPGQYDQIQREIVQKIKEMPFDKANKVYREVSPFLDKKSQDAARSLIAGKAPKKITKFDTIKNNIVSDLNKAFSTGERPKKVLDLWKTIKGQNLIEKALDNSPNKKEILGYLKKQSFLDFASSIIEKDGTIKFDKLNEYIRDPATIRNIEFIGGEEAVSFFQSLKNKAGGIQFNMRRIEQLPSSYLKLGEKEALLAPKKGKYPLGEKKLSKASERAKTPKKETAKFKEILPEIISKEQEALKTSAATRGKAKLKEMAKKREPLKFKIEELSDRFGITPTIKGVLATFGILKYTGATLGVAGSKVLYKLATKPSARRSINKLLNASKKASQKPYNLTPLLVSLSDVEEAFED